MDDKWFKNQQKVVGVTAEDIAKVRGRDRSVISHIYTGRQRMSLEWAEAFAEVLGQPLGEVLKRAGIVTPEKAQIFKSGLSESDAIPFTGKDHEASSIAASLGGGKPGIDIWEIKSTALIENGYLPGDRILLDTHLADRAGVGDVVIAQKYNWQTGSAETILRRFEPPVLVAANPAPGFFRVDVVDGTNVAIKGKVIASWRSTNS